jgi:cytoskeletal protein CcmA (bactofilin family)
MFRKRFPRGSRSRPELHERAAPVPAVPVEPHEPAPLPSPLKDIVAPRRPGASGLPRSPGRTLVVGRDIVLNGEIATCETLVIEGRVEGDIAETQHLEITETGRFKGRAEVRECVVAGACEGELTVAGLLTIRAKGRVKGAVRYVEIEIQRGGRLSGEVDAQAVREVASQPVADPVADPVAKAEAEAAARAPDGSPGSG